MTRNNQLYIDNDDGTGVCLACDRNFNTVNGALNHCRNAQTHEGEWCERCEWLFVSEAAHQTHVNASSRHNACETCDLDFNTHQELVTHDTEIHYYCSPCDKFFNNHRELDNHDVDFHCMCRDCGEFFINRNNLNQHKRTHLRRDIQCLGCDRDFAEFGAMLIHLESGNCQSEVDRDDIDNWIFDDYACTMFTTSWNSNYRYRCPGPGCGVVFRFPSALCQHVASDACRQRPDEVYNSISSCIEDRI